MNISSALPEFFLQHGLIFILYLILSISFLDILRQLNERPVNIKISFACLTTGCFSVAVYSLTNTLPLIVILIGFGLMPLCAHKVRYSFN